MKNIRAKILLFTVLMFACISVIIIFFSFRIIDKYKEMQMNECRMLIDFQAEGINKKIRELREDAKSIAICGYVYYNSPTRVKELGETSLKAHFNTGAVAVGGGFWFEPYKISSDQKRACYYAFNNGEKVLIDEGFLTEKYDYHTQIWYVTIKEQVKKIGDVAWSPPYFDAEGTLSLMVTAGAGIFDKDGSFIGMSTVDWKLDAISNVISRVRPTKNTFTLFADERNDYIMALNDKFVKGDPIGNSLKTLEWYDSYTGDETNPNHHPEMRFSYHGDVYISIARHLDNGMLIVVNIPEKELFAEINANARATIFMLATLCLLVAGLSYQALNRLISRPIDYLSEKAKEIGEGNFDVEISLNRSDEFETLPKHSRLWQRI